MGIFNYLSKLSPVTAKVHEPLRKLTLVKSEWSWNEMYQDLYDKGQKVNYKRYMCEILW